MDAGTPQRNHHSQFDLLRQRRFLPYFVVQLLGAFNDNVFRQAIIGLPQNGFTFLRGIRLLPPRAGITAMFTAPAPGAAPRRPCPAAPRSWSGTWGG